MSISLFELYNDTKSKYKLNLVAGNNGINNIISWVYYSEDNSTIDFIRGNELIFTTGLEYNHTENWLLELIKNLIKHNACGLVINTGNYIKNIPNDIMFKGRKYLKTITIMIFDWGEIKRYGNPHKRSKSNSKINLAIE